MKTGKSTPDNIRDAAGRITGTVAEQMETGADHLKKAARHLTKKTRQKP